MFINKMWTPKIIPIKVNHLLKKLNG